MVEYVFIFEVPNLFFVCFWCHAVYFNKIVCQTLCTILFIFGYVSYFFYQTPCTNIGAGFWIFVELGFPLMESSFVSLVNKPYRLCVSVFVSGVLWYVLCIFFLLVRLITCHSFFCYFVFLLLPHL